MLRRFYDKVLLRYPKLTLLCILAMTAFLAVQARNMVIDASAETLVLEDDKDLAYTRLVYSRYGVHDFLIVTFAPEGDLLSDHSLETIRRLKRDLEQIDAVTSVNSILDVPLLESPPRPIKELIKDIQTIESPSADRTLARREFINSPIYRNLLVSPDFRTTALQVNLRVDATYQKLLSRRDALKAKKRRGELAPEEMKEYRQAVEEFKAHRAQMRKNQHALIQKVRGVLERYRDGGELFLGGVSMIADDLITFVKNDLKVFGLGVFAFMVITLLIIFRQLRWILLPLLCVALSATAMMGILGLFGWEVTVISSNFISLQLIMTMAFAIHLIVRYREFLNQNPHAPQRQLVLDTVVFMATPCLYSALTTAAGFGSLILSKILPVINFGWMMSAGITVSLILTFLLFPCLVILLRKRPPDVSFESQFPFTKFLGRFTQKHGTLILTVSIAILVVSSVGMSRLVVENSFINYFKRTTEIYKGMELIDRQLGGTTPLDVIVDLEVAGDVAGPNPAANLPGDEGKDAFGDDFVEFEEEFEAAKDEAKYWFTTERMNRVMKIHDYLEAIPETGKVFSLGTMLKVGERLNEGEPLDNFDLALIYSELPEAYREIILDPFVSVEHNQVRFFIRVRDSEETLRRNELLLKIKGDLTEQLGIPEENVHLAGLLVLYNNMLQTLFRSQILTLGAAIFALMVMFLILFRSLIISLIAIFPNLLSIGAVLGFMGWMRIPLDMMTITIAAISMGIAVDNTIHYIHRFRREFPNDRNYIKTMHRCHGSIGYAMYYTSLTIIIGFSILVLSNFIPTIYFGFLTGLAMLIALMAALTLLPRLITWIKPFGPEAQPPPSRA